MRAIHGPTVRRVGDVRSARPTSRTLERVDFWQRRRPRADALGQAGPIVGAALGHRWGRERLFVECCESSRRQRPIEDSPSKLVVPSQREDDAAR